ncbi:MAG: hypothetical protein OIN89_09220 [Candidatus Methanoperedens sp.]|jgi:uncharacterized protein YdaT|nr:hypothetical protein [Candidatus Methanoperedens sp.]PKL52880.1 MAG: hypothetical protein CVV36_10135 [Candidatus Methanoperedenaceae archaeon HGW-Methanoperedenaceae-1]
MDIYSKRAIQQIDETLKHCQTLRSNAEKKSPFLDGVTKAEILAKMSSTISHLSPDKSVYRSQTSDFIRIFHSNYSYALNGLMGILLALRHDFQAGHLKTFHEMVQADVFSNFLDMADYLLEEGYKDAAAVIIGGILEQHLRNLSLKNNMPTVNDNNKTLKTSTMNDALAGKLVYSKTDQKIILAWLGIRNDAAHGNYGNYEKKQVSLMLQGVRDFISRNPA